MVNSRAQQLDEVFFALSDPTRRAILANLAEGDLTVAELSEPFDISAPAISKHLKVLERAGLLARERVGRSKRARFVPEPLEGAAEWVDRYRSFWETKLDSLTDYLNQPELGVGDVDNSGEHGPGERGPGEHGPGEHGPGEHGPRGEA